MEDISLKLGQDEEFDRAVHCGTAQASPVTIVTKDEATTGGKAGAVLSFEVHRGGETFPVQATVTVGLLLMTLAGLNGRYDQEGRKRPEVP